MRKREIGRERGKGREGERERGKEREGERERGRERERETEGEREGEREDVTKGYVYFFHTFQFFFFEDPNLQKDLFKSLLCERGPFK